MDFNIIECILLAIVTFIFAIDQFSLTEVLYRPIIACTIIGTILGDTTTGLIVGGTYEIIAIGNMPVGGAQPPNVVLTGIASCILAITAKLEVETALGIGIIFALFGQYVVTLVFTIMSGLMSKADKAAAEANPKGITNVLNISMTFLGCLFAIIAVASYIGGQQLAETLQQISQDYAWVMAGLGAAGGMLKFVGFAILMKIMMANDMWGIFLAGFAVANLFGGVETVASATLIFIAFIGVAIAIYDYTTSIKNKSVNIAGNGGMSDGI